MADDVNELVDKLKGLLDGGGADGLKGLLGGGGGGIENLMGLLGGGGPKKSESSNGGLDVDTIMKFKTAYDKVNSRPDPRVSLLSSLRPYMNTRRAGELDTVVRLLSLTKITDVVKMFKGGI